MTESSFGAKTIPSDKGGGTPYTTQCMLRQVRFHSENGKTHEPQKI
ncbi:MAG: hypothetical protein K5657_04325 [Desulfovibrio sp.]|nr:hypothetical protein [Desulfovibrio sp.]